MIKILQIEVLNIHERLHLILNSYKKTNQRIIYSSTQIRNDIDESEYIELKNMKCNTTINIVILIYHIKKELLLVIKKQYDSDNQLIEREIENYKRLNKEYPLFPFFFGTNKNGHIFIEYINSLLGFN